MIILSTNHIFVVFHSYNNKLHISNSKTNFNTPVLNHFTNRTKHHPSNQPNFNLYEWLKEKESFPKTVFSIYINGWSDNLQ